MFRSFIVFGFAILISSSAFAEKGGDVGVGFMLGSPSSLNAKFFQDSKVAFDVGLAFDSDDYVMIYGDYLVHFPGMFKSNSQFINSLNPYIGAGPVIAFADHNNHNHGHKFFNDHDDDFAIGLRIPVGVEWRATEIPLGVALEIGPGLMVVPDTESLVTVGLAFRYYF